MVNVPSTAQTLSDDYVAMGTWIGLATDDPGNSPAPANEVPVVVDGYMRQQTTWMPDADEAGVYQGSQVTFDVPSGAYPFMILCGDMNGNTMIDNCKINNVILNTDGKIVVIPTYTQT
jgi:hypothetical protein